MFEISNGAKYNTSFHNKETPQGKGVSFDIIFTRQHVRDKNVNREESFCEKYKKLYFNTL